MVAGGYKLATIAAGLLCIWLGYRLFCKGVLDKAGDMEATWGTLMRLVGVRVLGGRTSRREDGPAAAGGVLGRACGGALVYAPGLVVQPPGSGWCRLVGVGWYFSSSFMYWSSSYCCLACSRCTRLLGAVEQDDDWAAFDRLTADDATGQYLRQAYTRAQIDETLQAISIEDITLLSGSGGRRGVCAAGLDHDGP